jgi:antitoxin (DNA-binding transcriptional repressor) of toxin-antitoxin stability system
MKNLIGLKDLREKINYYSKQINRGQSFIVMRKSQPLFRLSPVEDDEWETLIDFTKLKKGGLDIDDLLKRL